MILLAMPKCLLFLLLFLLIFPAKALSDNVNELIRMLKSGDNLIRIEASEKLVNLGTSIDKRLLKILKEENNQARHSVLWILGEWGEKKYFDLIVSFLDKSFMLSRAAIVALGKIGDLRAVPYLVEKLGAKSRYIRTDVVYALGRVGDKKALPYITNVKDDPDWHVREAVAVALGQIGDSKVIELLQKMSNYDSDALVRIAAYDSLKSLGFEYNTMNED